MCRMRENYEYDMFENYSEVVMLLVKVRATKFNGGGGREGAVLA